MVRILGLLLLLAVTVPAVPAVPANPNHVQQVLHEENQHKGPTGNPRKLKGKFLHITDLHPDPFYRVGAPPREEHPCHKGRGNSSVGYYGAAKTACDSPFTLINATFDWIQKNIKDEIDFVVWTGDSARHDNDEGLPRSNRQVVDLNQYIVQKFVETFGKPDKINDPDPTNDFIVPIIPTLGNNDILPHNIFAPGPNTWTRNFINIWKQFVPEEQKHSFTRGGWFWTEVIPNRLGVISLNTLYFFDKNSAVDGCDLHSEPGYEHMEWLRAQLQFLRQRGMKAILIGHVPPARTDNKQGWDETCYQKFVLWQRQYRDIIVANMFGHMNVDHFMFHDMNELKYKFPIDGIEYESAEDEESDAGETSVNPPSNDTFEIEAMSTYLNELRISWNNLPTPPKGMTYKSLADADLKRNDKDKKRRNDFIKKIGGPFGERFSMSIVSPSVVPNYFPTLRIIEYNMTGLENDHPAMGSPQGHLATERDLLHYTHPHKVDESEGEQKWSSDIDTEMDEGIDDEEEGDVTQIPNKKGKGKKGNKGKKGKHGKKPKRKAPFPVPAPPSKTSPPGPAYSPQTFSLLSWTQLYANLTLIHEKMAEDKSLTLNDDIDSVAKHAKDHFRYDTEYTTSHDGVYNLRDLTMKHWLGLAEAIGRTIYKKSKHDLDPFSEEEEVEHTRPIEVSRSVNENYDMEDDHDSTVSPNRRKRKSLGKFKNNELWREFVRRAFVHAKSDAELEDEFE